MTQRILVVDDDAALKESLELILASEDVEVLGAANGKAALERLEAVAIDVVLCERGVSGLDGLDLLPQIARRLPGAAIVLTSAGASQELAAEALQRGAYSSLTKPIAAAEIQLTLRKARERRQLRRANLLLQRDVLRTQGERPIVAASPPMIELLELLERAAEFKTPALLTGESGTGKEVLARAIHAQSPRRNGPFVSLDCAATPEHLLAGELFGSTVNASGNSARARSGLLVEAQGGCIFLDEVGELPGAIQLELLRALQEEEVRPVGESKARKIDVRVVAASARDLDEDTRSGRFREDLLQRLSLMHLRVPALRDRRQDIPLLIDHFLARSCETPGRSSTRMADDALERLSEYSWPGNIRELENVVERAVLLAGGGRVTMRQLPADIVAASREGNESDRHDFSLKQARRIAEAEVIERALSATRGNRTHAAKLLEISHRALLYKIKDYQIRN